MRKLLLPLAAALAVASAAPAQAAPPTGDGDGGFELTPIGNFDAPIDLEAPAGYPNALFVAEHDGVLRVIKNGTTLPTPLLDIQGLVQNAGASDEEGLLSVATSPDFHTNHLLYLYFTNNNSDNQVMEFRTSRRSPFRVTPGSGRLVLYVSHPFAANHNGGELQFGPDGFLYLSTGDGGGGGDQFNQAQDHDSLLGKLLRFDPRQVTRCVHGKRAHRRARRRGLRCGREPRAYTAAKGNPFVGKPGRDEIYAIGLRNPFRYSFDATTGAISIGDVGQGCLEEIDYRRRGRARGANFGWGRFEGTSLYNPSKPAPNAIPPIFEYTHGGDCPDPPGDFQGQAVIGGFVVRDKRLRHQYGRLLFSDAYSDDIRTLIPRPGRLAAKDEQSTGVSIPAGSPYSFAQDQRRRLYVVSGAGPVYRLEPAS